MAADNIDDLAGELTDAFVARGGALLEASDEAVGEKGVDAEDVLAGAAVEDGAGAGGVVADAAADVGVTRGGGVGGEEEARRCEGVAEVVDGDAGLDAAGATGGIDFEDAGAAVGEIDNDGVVGALTGEGRSAAAGEDWDNSTW